MVSILKHVIVLNEGFSRLNILLGSLPHSLFDNFLQKKGFRELDVPFVVCLLRWFLCLLGHGFFLFVLCINANPFAPNFNTCLTMCNSLLLHIEPMPLHVNTFLNNPIILHACLLVEQIHEWW